MLTVNGSALSSIAITPSSLTPLGLGATQQLTATGTYADGTTQPLANAIWTTPNGNVVSVSNASGSIGLLTAVGIGLTTVTATFGGVSSSPTLSVTVVAAGTNADGGT